MMGKTAAGALALAVLAGTAWADSCDYKDSDIGEAAVLFLEAKSQYGSGEYRDADETLQEATKLHSNGYRDGRITVEEECIRLVPGPYAPIRKIYPRTSEQDYNVRSLGYAIRSHMAPRPVLVVQYVPDGSGDVLMEKAPAGRGYEAVVTLANAADEENAPLDHYQVRIGGRSTGEMTIEAGEREKRTLRVSSPRLRIVSQERYGFILPEGEGR